MTATDYQGLGTPGVHQYVVGATEARNVLDSVKAAQQIPRAGAGNDVVALGWSQGGGSISPWIAQHTEREFRRRRLIASLPEAI